MKKASSVPVHSVGKAMELIEILLHKRSAMTLAELAEHAGYPKSTVYALLATMLEYSMIAQLSDGRYYLGMRLFECGHAVSAQWNVSTVAHPYLETLAHSTNSGSFISIMDGDAILNLEQVTAGTGIQISGEIGYRLPLHATSQGKLFLSHLTDAEIKRKMRSIGMPSFTPHTYTKINPFLDNLHQIATDGYAVSDGEYKIGLRSVAAPVYNHQGEMTYTIGIIGLFRSTHSAEFASVITKVKETALQLSHAIGYRI